MDIDRLTDELQASRDHRIKYIIANSLIMSGNGGPAPWVWRAYSGSNPHTSHMHISVVASPACDDPAPWHLASFNNAAPPAGEDDMLADERHALFDILHQMTGNAVPGEFPGWPSYAAEGTNLTPLDYLRWADKHVNTLLAGSEQQNAAVENLALVVGERHGVDGDAVAVAIRATIDEEIAQTSVRVNVDVAGQDEQ